MTMLLSTFTLRRATALSIVLVGAVGLAGCAVGPDFQRPVGPTEDRFTAETLKLEAPANAASATASTMTGTVATSRTGADAAQRLIAGASLDRQWWQRFQSPALDGVVQNALAGNRTLVAASATLQQAAELAAAQAGTLAPQIGLTGGVGRQKYGAEFLGTFPAPPDFTYFAIGPSISYTLDYTGGLARSVEQQRAFAEVRQQQLDAAYLSVTGNTVTEALRIASVRAQIATLQVLLDRDRENVKLVQEAFDAGSVSRLDVVTADSQLASDTTLMPPLQQQLSVSRHALAVLMGSTPAGAALPEFDLAQLALPRELPVSLPSELAHRRPDILAAEAQLHAATAAVGVATSNLYPHINLMASGGQQTVSFSHLFDRGSAVWSLTSGIVAPLFDGGTLRAQKRASIDAMHASAANYEQAVLVAFGQVADSLQALDHGAEQLQAQTRAQQVAQDNVDLTRRSFHEGNVGVLQVLDAERLYQRARLGYVQAEAQRYIDTVQLFMALGGAGPGA